MSRYTFFLLFVVVMIFFTGLDDHLFAASHPERTEDPPVNIVIFVADDLGATDIGPYGNRVVRTPNIDQLAKQSVKFTQAFATSPTCSPSRNSILTGMMPFRNGAHANHTGIKEGVETLPKYFRQLGYQVAIAGKFHIGPMDAYPFELIHNTNVPEPGHEDDGVLWADLNMEPVDQWLAEASREDNPFMLVVNDHSPHVIWPEKPTYDPSTVDIPPKHIDTKDTRRARTRYYTDITKMDQNVGRLLKSLEKNDLVENTVVIFTADQGPQWPFGKWSLYEYGIRVPLLVKWPDMIAGGTDSDALVSLVDLLPTTLEAAGRAAPKSPGEMDGKSFLPVLKNSKTEHRDRVFATHTGDGTMNRSPLRMLRTDRYKYILNLAPDIRYTTHMDKSKNHDGGRQYWDSWLEQSYKNEHAASVLWRYHNHPKEELYDIKADPKETNNLAHDSNYAEILEKFRTEVAQWREQQGDHEKGPYKPKKRKHKGPVAPYIFK